MIMRGEQDDSELQGEFFVTMHVQMDPEIENGERLRFGLKLLLECCQRMDPGAELVSRNAFRQQPNITTPDDPNFPVFTNEIVNYCKPTNLQLLRQSPIDPSVLQKRLNNEVKGPTTISAHVKIRSTLHPSWVSELIDAVRMSMSRQQQISVYWKNLQCWDSTVGVEITGLHEDADEEIVQSALSQIVTGMHSLHLKSVLPFRVFCCKKTPQIFKVEAVDDAWPWLLPFLRRVDTNLHNLVLDLLDPMSDQYLREHWDGNLEDMRKSILQKTTTRVSIKYLTRSRLLFRTLKHLRACPNAPPSSSTSTSISPKARRLSPPASLVTKIHPSTFINKSPSTPTFDTLNPIASQSSDYNNLLMSSLVASPAITLDTATSHTLQRKPPENPDTTSNNSLHVQPPFLLTEYSWLCIGLSEIKQSNLAKKNKDIQTNSRWRGFSWEGHKTNCSHNNPLIFCTSAPPTGSQSTTPAISPSSETTSRHFAPTPTSPSISPSSLPISSLPVSPDISRTISPSTSPRTSFSTSPTVPPTSSPSVSPTIDPSMPPSRLPSRSPSISQSTSASTSSNISPNASPSAQPSIGPSTTPSMSPSANPSFSPSHPPSFSTTSSPSTDSSNGPSVSPANAPPSRPTISTCNWPNIISSSKSSVSPAVVPSSSPSISPSFSSLSLPIRSPSVNLSNSPTTSPTTNIQPLTTQRPSTCTKSPTATPSASPSVLPTNSHSAFPSMTSSRPSYITEYRFLVN